MILTKGELMQQQVESEGAPRALGPYSLGIITEDLIFCSGQLGIDPLTGSLCAPEVGAQAEKAMENLAEVLKAAGSSLAKLVKTTIFLKDMGDFERVNQVYSRYVSRPFPARSTVQVAALPKDALVEIEAIALRPRA